MFMYQGQREAHVMLHETSMYMHRIKGQGMVEVTNPGEKLHSEKYMAWSPKGTYLIQIKHDKVEFLGGSRMMPIITLPESNVDRV